MVNRPWTDITDDYANAKPNPWADIKLRDDAPRLPRWARVALKVVIGLFLAWWLFCWLWLVMEGAL